MRSRAVPVLASLLVLALTSCDSRPAEQGGGGIVPVSGAHTAHLEGGVAVPIDCGECHDRAFQVTLKGHLATANGADPSFNPKDLTCSSVYCHAGGTTLRIGGGTVTAPVWNPPSSVPCNGCHAAPGGAVDTKAWHSAVAPGVQCAICHPGYTNVTVDEEIHVNGVANLKFADMATNCSACHGDASRALPAGISPVVRAAPPVDRDGRSATTLPSVGAHQAHLLPGAGAIASPIACRECHPVPTDLTHVGPLANSPAKLAWGTLASSGSATPAYDAATATCTNYCHGQTLGAGGVLTTPVWTRVDGAQSACGTCHGSPPSDASHQLHAGQSILAIGCSHCHPAGYAVRSVGPEAVPVHVNGVVDTSTVFLPDWNSTAVGPTGWTGTSVVGCHGGTRYWNATTLAVSGCY